MSPNSVQIPQPHHSQAALAAKIANWDETHHQLTVLVEKDNALISEFFSQLNTICEQSADWNSQHAKPVNYYSAVNAVRLFAEIMTELTPGPQLVPTNRGNLQFEWHQDGIDLELEITDGGEIICCFEDLKAGTDEEWSGSFSYGAARLRSYLEILISRFANRKCAA
ncbi:MAG: hypothetical protein WC028_03035 [Candidatus Obscuribacterales bacterium]